MPKQLIYTSSKRGLELGRSGYCTVARSEGMRKGISSELESISSYDFSKSSPGPIYSYRVLCIQGIDYCVCSRISNCGFDYTGRTNFIAHHVVFEQSELSEYLNPAYFMLNWSGWRDSWNEPPRELADGDFPALKRAEMPKRWSDFSASENAAFLNGDVKCVFKGVACGDFLELLAESLNCRKNDSWRYSFTTRLQKGESPGQYSIILDSNSDLGLVNRLVVDPRHFKIGSVGKSFGSASEIEAKRAGESSEGQGKVRLANRRRYAPSRGKYPKSLLYPIYASLAILVLFSAIALSKYLSGESDGGEAVRFIPTVDNTAESVSVIEKLHADKPEETSIEVGGTVESDEPKKVDIAKSSDNAGKSELEENTEAIAKPVESAPTVQPISVSDSAKAQPPSNVAQASGGDKKQPLEAHQFESIQKLFGLNGDFKSASKIFIILYDKEGNNLTEKAFYKSLREHSEPLKLLVAPQSTRLEPQGKPQKLIVDERLIFDWKSGYIPAAQTIYFKKKGPTSIMFELEGETSAAIMLMGDSGLKCPAAIDELLSNSEELLSLRGEFVKLFKQGQIILPSSYTFGINIVFDDENLGKIFGKFRSDDKLSYSKSDAQKFIGSLALDFEKYKALCANLEKLEQALNEALSNLKGGEAKNIADYISRKKEHLRDILNNPPSIEDNGEIEARSLNNKIDSFVGNLKNKLNSIDKKKEKISGDDFKDFQNLVEEQSAKLGEATGFMETSLKSIREDIGDILGIFDFCDQIEAGKVNIKNARLELAEKLEVPEENLDEAMESVSRPFDEILKSGNVELIFYKNEKSYKF